MDAASHDVAESIPLIVREMRWEARDVLALTLERPDGAELPAWEPGAHIDLRLPNGVERQYSLCSDPADRRSWRIAVLREDVSRGGSRFVHTELRAGDLVSASAPRNNFALVPAAETLFIAGGIGITPILPMVAAVAESTRPWRMLYLGRDSERMAYLAHPLLARHEVQVFAADSDRGAEAGGAGASEGAGSARVDLAGWIGELAPGAAVYACGPTRLLDALEELSLDWPAGTLHLERFQPKSFADLGDGDTFEVEARRSGLRVTVDPGCSILEMLERAGIPAPSSCLEGVCGTCETPIIDGEAEHRDSILAPDERAANETMMICVSRSITPSLVLDI